MGVILEELLKYSIFSGCKLKSLEKIFSELDYTIKTIEKDTTVFFKDEKIDGLSLILKGELTAEMLKENGDIQKIEKLSKGDIIASAFIFGENNYIPVDLLCIGKCEILFIDRKNLLKIFKQDENILLNFLNDISNKTQFLSKKVWKNFTMKTIREKLLNYIDENNNREESTVIFKHSIKELAELFNVSRPSLSRVLSELIDEKILEKIEKNKYRVK